jgi:hypothetical protein
MTPAAGGARRGHLGVCRWGLVTALSINSWAPPIVPGDPDERMYGVVCGSMRNGPRAGYLRVIEPLSVFTNLLERGPDKGMRATRWTEGYSMAKKAASEPMECQPAQYGDAMPMAAAPTTKPQDPRAMPTIRQTWCDDDPCRCSDNKSRQLARRTARERSVRRRSRLRGHDTQLGPINVTQCVERAVTS